MKRKPNQLSPHFWRKEFECGCGCGFNIVDAELIAVLEELRSECGDNNVNILSGCRCSNHNKRVGGYKNSKHLIGKAADIRIRGVAVDEVARRLLKLFPNSYGIGQYNNWTHIDVRNKKGRWDER